MKELLQIQKELKVPKSKYNEFSNFYYRSCEDIFNAVKPLCEKNNCILMITDQLELIGDRYYIKATAKLINKDGEMLEATAYAREAENKPKFDEAQVTGSASTYARKYALNGLFLLDDSVDVDSLDNTKKEKPPAKPRAKKTPTKTKKITARDKVIVLAKERNIPFTELAKDYGLDGNTSDKRFEEVLAHMEGRNG